MWYALVKKSNQVLNLFDTISSKNYITNVYGVSRSLFALGTFITLIFNSNESLFAINQYKMKENLSLINEINLFHLFDYEGLYISKIISLVILLLVIFGIYPRYTGILHWWVSVSFFNAGTIVEGGDQITANVLFFLIPITLMDNRKNHWINSINTNIYKNFTSYWIFQLINLQIAVLYLQAAVEKPFKVPEWVDGTAIYYWLNHNLFGLSSYLEPIINPLFDIPILLFCINWGVIVFELILFGAFFMEKKRKRQLLLFGILFHLSIAIAFGLVSFFIAMSACLIIYLCPKENQFNFKEIKHGNN